MIRLANSSGSATVDYWFSSPFTWNVGQGVLIFNHNNGKYVKHARVYFPTGTAFGNDRMVHDGFARDASGTGNDYGIQCSSQTLNQASFYFFNPYPDFNQSNCVLYLEFLEATLPN